MDGLLVTITSRINKFASIYLYTWMEKNAVRIKSVAQEHNTMSPARDRSISGDERTSSSGSNLCLFERS